MHIFLQLALILLACRLVGLVAKKIGQPQVIGEMVAGIVLGPSLFGWAAPDLQQWFFPRESLSIIGIISQLALVLYMFVVGLEFDTTLIKNRFTSAIAVSLAGIIAPLILGGLLAWVLYHNVGFFPAQIALPAAMLFLGTAMSVTAFPVLSRIIHERGLAGTTLGTLALAASSIDDAVAWCLLAIVLATLNGMSNAAILAISGAIAYTLVVLLIGRPLLKHLGTTAEKNGKVNSSLLVAAVVLIMLGAWITDTIGIHAVFGAFILGVAMPRGVFARDLRRMIEPVTLNVLLPLFFVSSGLNTTIGLVSTPFLWLITLAIILNATIGKFVACWLAARTVGESQQVSLGLGTLMNTRGLVELILLNIGLNRGVITPTLFAMMVIMALATTFMTTPLFNLVYGRFMQRTSENTLLRLDEELHLDKRESQATGSA